MTDPKALAVSRYCRLRGYPPPAAEVRFAPPRRWALDLAWVPLKIGLEIEGALFGMGKKCPLCGRRAVGGHSSIERLKTDMEKYNEAALRGWRLVRVRPEQIKSGEVYELLDRLFGGKNA